MTVRFFLKLPFSHASFKMLISLLLNTILSNNYGSGREK